MTRVCVLASVGHDLGTIAVNEGEPIGEEPIAAFPGTAATSGTWDDSFLALRNSCEHIFLGYQTWVESLRTKLAYLINEARITGLVARIAAV